ncbi:MAG: DNA mismatch repair endonuclease MutL [Bacteroidota bacterium]|nr:DNA mismatch repair endonuclease MutL [Bacteroidota bacterium]MDX5430230.1 DNA mismatch repair endonuclease MutL [Bacteroidota bacterium]MDX5468991.1 DNA mismatch repair endonuclease MutL [Bacteroidota bacterium]
MGNIVSVLPDAIANQIAAGEVIQRPASVVKELMENAIDAGADQIELIIKDSGRTLIQVMDNGKGMSPLDARVCWERHATSKIKKAEDLFQIKTFGFRGEALASIASVAQVEMKTCLEKEELGTLIIIEGSEVKKQEACVHSRGTSIAVKNLFYNIPARRNFLKSNAVEFKHIVDEFVRVAMPNPEVSMRLIHNDHCLYDLKADTLKRRIASLLGVSEEDFFYGEEHSPAADYRLFLGSPQIAKKTRGEQYFIVNGRFIKDPYLNHAIQQEFKNYLPEDHHASYVAFLDLDPSHIDINVHPTKTEIKFEDERTLYALLKSVVKKILAEHHLGDTESSLFDDHSFHHLLNAQVDKPEFPTLPKSQTTPGYNPFGRDKGQNKKNLGHWQDLYAGLEQSTPVPDLRLPIEDLPREERPPLIQVSGVLQITHKYLAVQGQQELLIVDQELAHQRVLFEKFMQHIRDQKSTSQQLLFPRVIEFSANDAALVEDILEEIRHLGFDINPFGNGSFIINGLPPEADKAEAKGLLEGLIEEYKASSQVDTRDKQQDVARALAKRSAIRQGQKLSAQEMNHLVQEWLMCREPGISPFGKKVFVKFDENSLNKLFH